MDLGSLLLILALSVIVAIFVGRPLMERRSSSVSVEEQAVSSLLAERERILSALLELDFDHNLGKVPDEFYPLQRNELLQRGAEILRQLDAYPMNGAGEDSNETLEAAVAERRAKVTVSVGEQDDLEGMIAARRQAGAQSSVRYCHQCGSGLQPGDKFCSHCGAQVA